MRTLLVALSLFLMPPSVLADQIILVPGQSLPLSPVDVVICQAADGVAYDYCACANLGAEGWAVYRYRKFINWPSSTLLNDQMVTGLASEAQCNQRLSTLAVCQTPFGR